MKLESKPIMPGGQDAFALRRVVPLVEAKRSCGSCGGVGERLADAPVMNGLTPVLTLSNAFLPADGHYAASPYRFHDER